MKKKISIILLGLVIIGAGFFVYVKFFKLDSLENRYIESSPREDYVVQEVDGKTFVNNEKAGISFFVPEGWEIREELDDSFIIYTYGAKNNEKRIEFLEKGCRILIKTSNVKTNIKKIKNEFEQGEKYYLYDIDEYEEENSFLRHIYKYTSINNYFEDIYMPKNEKLYIFGLTIDNTDNNCKNEFDKILNEAEIGK